MNAWYATGATDAASLQTNAAAYSYASSVASAGSVVSASLASITSAVSRKVYI
jgi:hypothetical protein